jgi:hypothetical protein
MLSIRWSTEQSGLLTGPICQPTKLTGQQQRWILLAPKADLNDPIVVTAWRVQLRVDDASDERILQFIKKYQQGPFTPEPGATCTFGGIGEPLS